MFNRTILAIALLMAATGTAAADPQIATKVVAVIEKNLSPENFIGIYEFTNTRLDKTTTQYIIQFESRDVNHTRGYFQKPERDKGRETLRIDENLWTWMPSVGKIVRIADRDSFAGGDFSNADVMRADWLSKYNAEMAKETANQYIIDLKAKTPDAAYAKMRLWVDKKNGQPVQQQYYDSNGTLLKRCLYGSVRKTGSIERPMHLQMENVITKQKSELKILDLKLDQKIPESRFVTDNLGK